MVDAASNTAANEKQRGETMLECPDQQHADRHFAPGNCVLGCTKVTLTEDCSMSVLTPLEWTQRPLRVKSRPHGITQTLCPLYPRKRTNSRHLEMSALCQKRTHAPQHKVVLNHRVGEREQIVYRLYKSPSPYSDQRALTRASSSGDGRTVGGKRSSPHSGRRGFLHERVASISIRFQSPVPSCATSRSSSGVLGSMGEPKIPGKMTTPPSPAFTRCASAHSTCSSSAGSMSSSTTMTCL